MKTQAILNKHAAGFQDGINGKPMTTKGLKGDQKKAYENGWHEGAKNRRLDRAWAAKASWVV